MKNEELKSRAIKEEAERVALELINHAKETARQMIMNTNLDTNKIPLICNKIIRIQTDIKWVKLLLGGIATLLLYIVFKK